MLDDKLITGFTLPQTSVQFTFGSSNKDVRSVLVHFDPTTSVPRHILVTNCDAESRSFDLEDQSIFFLNLGNSWRTKCMNVTFGPDKYVHDSGRDIMVVQ
eukprot:TCALIF_03925-PA protein Name:"Protein of unknown function" AED:0.13 eAED:0.13 QI:158/1/0.66/1/0.5/0.33/3/0/99